MIELPPSNNLGDVRIWAEAALSSFGLSAWVFDFNKRKSSLGLCCYKTKSIYLSAPFVQLNQREAIRDTLLHEIAHALVGPGHGHGRVWKLKAMQIGCRPERCSHAEMPKGEWRAQCGGCGKEFDMKRKPKRLVGWNCKRCGPKVGQLVWTKGECDAV